MFEKYPLERLKVVPSTDKKDYYEVEKVISHKGAKRKEKYLMKWKNYSEKHNYKKILAKYKEQQ